MKRHRAAWWLVLVVLGLGFVGCSDDGGGGGSPTADQDNDGLDPSDEDAAGESENPPVGEDSHCCWTGASWSTIWPVAGEQATYSVKTFLQEEKDLPAYVDYTPVEWKGGQYSRFIVGTPEPGHDGMVVYFDRSVPWNPKAKGIEAFSSDDQSGPSLVEWFDEPAGIDLNKPAGSTSAQTHPMHMQSGTSDPTDLETTYAFTYVDYNKTIDTPYGSVSGCMHLHVEIEQDLGGDEPITFAADVYLHPEHFFVGMTNAPAFVEMWMKTAWQ